MGKKLFIHSHSGVIYYETQSHIIFRFFEAQRRKRDFSALLGKLDRIPDNIDRSGEYASVMDGLRGTLGFLKKASEPYILLGRSYVIFNSDFNDMLEKHIDSGADISMMYFDNSDDATNCDYDGVYLKPDESGRITDMCYSETKHRYGKKSMDVYIMKRELLIDPRSDKGIFIHSFRTVCNVFCGNIDTASAVGLFNCDRR